MERPISPIGDVTIVGGGMYVQEVLLPSLYQLQRGGRIGDITVCTRSANTVRAVRDNTLLATAFPDRSFTPSPAFDVSADEQNADLYKEVIRDQDPDGTVVVCLPDHMHHEAIMAALDGGQNVLSVKPLTQKFQDTLDIATAAHDRGLFVGVEYHKRFDNRSLMARKYYQEGRFGEFAVGDASMIEPYGYRSSNFQNWFTPENADPYTYVGCHYIDLVNFITRLRVKELSVKGFKGKFPNGNEGYMWTNSLTTYENDATLSMINGLGYPDEGAGSNDQGIRMFFERDGGTSMLKHDDQFRGSSYSFAAPDDRGHRQFQFVSPDFFQLVPWEGQGLRPVGYGYRSVAAIVEAINDIKARAAAVSPDQQLALRQSLIRKIDSDGLIATPNNTAEHELVSEAARLSLEHEGAIVSIHYGDNPFVKLK
ncbi:Gfo/Idh/MocA family oxidoreductase [Candidatus Gracilibacteria bacterium]|nr:Gfo/Idh/MocA family oxidoreductase [Candidatus Gracilibacteria bacterium]